MLFLSAGVTVGFSCPKMDSIIPSNRRKNARIFLPVILFIFPGVMWGPISPLSSSKSPPIRCQLDPRKIACETYVCFRRFGHVLIVHKSFACCRYQTESQKNMRYMFLFFVENPPTNTDFNSALCTTYLLSPLSDS